MGLQSHCGRMAALNLAIKSNIELHCGRRSHRLSQAGEGQSNQNRAAFDCWRAPSIFSLRDQDVHLKTFLSISSRVFAPSPLQTQGINNMSASRSSKALQIIEGREQVILGLAMVNQPLQGRQVHKDKMQKTKNNT